MCINTTPIPVFASNIVYNCKINCIFDPMPDIEAAIVELFNSDLFNNICRRYGGNNHEDLKSEVMLIICELSPERKKQMVENQYLTQYALQIARFQGIGDRRTARGNSFQRKFADPTMVYTDKIIEAPEQASYQYKYVNDYLEPAISARVNRDGQEQTNPFFYHSRLLLETIKYKTIKEAASAIGIPYVSVRRNLKEYKHVLNEWLKSQQS